jgi:hypothetical protein
VILGLACKASCLLGRSSTTWTTLPVLLVLVIFWHRDSHFWSGPRSSYLCSHIAGVTGACHHSQLRLRWDLTNFLPRLTSNHNPPSLSFLSNWGYRHEPPHPLRFFGQGFSLLWWQIRFPEGSGSRLSCNCPNCSVSDLACLWHSNSRDNFELKHIKNEFKLGLCSVI